ncbi:SMC-Scp complex subunit ScpB [Neorhizobium sp. NCHU2750]|uniref:MarR family winged helix-turn-helix transcriptional regulator n=1 Tax=Neorhizobium sp. NCHU2750 TaxID=1825976 RepID=UPI000E7261F7|nr:MarR family transcriptional regulator [Neorhizobium sp. NCHU2750]
MLKPAPTLGFLLNDVARLLRKRFEQNARHIGLTRAQWQTIAYLAYCEGIHQKALAELLEITPISLMRVLDNLAERGLVERRPHETDRRVTLLYTTEAARALLDDGRKIGEATRAEALETISEADRGLLYEMLSTMKINLVDACRVQAQED